MRTVDRSMDFKADSLKCLYTCVVTTNRGGSGIRGIIYSSLSYYIHTHSIYYFVIYTERSSGINPKRDNAINLQRLDHDTPIITPTSRDFALNLDMVPEHYGRKSDSVLF